jgi:hypothetical protein
MQFDSQAYIAGPRIRDISPEKFRKRKTIFGKFSQIKFIDFFQKKNSEI